MNAKSTAQGLRAGIVGAGFISDFHLRAIAQEKGVELVAICDLSMPAAKKLAAQHPAATVYTDYGTMLKEARLDVVHVLTQPDSHFRLAKLALETDCHVILEKPVTATSEEAEELSHLAAEKRRIVGVNHNFVFSRPFRSLRKLMARGELGPLKSLRLVWKKPLAQMTFGPWNLWMLRKPGNILFEIGSHVMSELLALSDTPEIVRVEAHRPKILPSGVVFYRRFDIAAKVGSATVHIEIYFDQGYTQHFVEVEGMFGTARADMENDVFTSDLPTGRAYDAERFHVNLQAGLARVRQAFHTYASYGGSKFVKVATGSPYESSMFRGISTCYSLIRGEAGTRESTLAFGMDVMRASEAMVARMPPVPKIAASECPAMPKAVSEPGNGAKILLVGASGFIGKRLLSALQEKKHGVRAVVRNVSSLVGVDLAGNSEVMVADFRNEEAMEKALRGIEVVFHLAVAHGKSLEGYLKADTEPTLRFARQCQRHGVKRFIYTGTIDSLDLASSRPLKESDGVDAKLARRNNYAHSKAIAERRLMEMFQKEHFPLVIVRPAIVLGVGGPVAHVGVANWSGLGHCAYWGDGQNPLPLVLVEDVAKGLMAAMDTPGIEGRTYNLSAQPCISARDYVAEVEKVLGCTIAARPSHAIDHYVGDLLKWSIKVLARHPDRTRVPSLHDWHCREQHASFDVSAARRDLGWEPINDRETILEKGVREPARSFLQDGIEMVGPAEPPRPSHALYRTSLLGGGAAEPAQAITVKPMVDSGAGPDARIELNQRHE